MSCLLPATVYIADEHEADDYDDDDEEDDRQERNLPYGT